jgi:hypothetical protein
VLAGELHRHVRPRMYMYQASAKPIAIITKGVQGTQPGTWWNSWMMWFFRPHEDGVAEVLDAVLVKELPLKTTPESTAPTASAAERDQHHQRALVRLVGMAVAVIVVVVVLGACAWACGRRGHGGGMAMRVVMMAVGRGPARLAVEGHEDQAPGVERGHQRRDHQS